MFDMLHACKIVWGGEERLRDIRSTIRPFEIEKKSKNKLNNS